MRFLSKEYLTKKASARKRANPPIQASNFTPINFSQSIKGILMRELAGFIWAGSPDDNGFHSGDTGFHPIEENSGLATSLGTVFSVGEITGGSGGGVLPGSEASVFF